VEVVSDWKILSMKRETHSLEIEHPSQKIIQFWFAYKATGWMGSFANSTASFLRKFDGVCTSCLVLTPLLNSSALQQCNIGTLIHVTNSIYHKRRYWDTVVVQVRRRKKKEER
jgi:thiamine transporter ThiT